MNKLSLFLTVESRSNSDQDDGHAPVPQEWAEPRSITVPDLLEGEFVCDRVFDDQDVGLLQNLPYARPVTVQQVLEERQQISTEERRKKRSMEIKGTE